MAGVPGRIRRAALAVPDLRGEPGPFIDEGLAYADKLRAAGVAMALDLVRGVTHEFIKMGRVLKEAGAALDAAAAALQGAWRP